MSCPHIENRNHGEFGNTFYCQKYGQHTECVGLQNCAWFKKWWEKENREKTK